jgi:hypothetical protein
MPRPKITQPYECIACGYSTFDKNHMRTHLLRNKTPCPKLLNDITLTDEIKEYILQNRVYHISKTEPKTTQQIINQTINNYNQINNIVINMEFHDKLEKYMTHTKREVIDFEEDIEDRFADKAMRLERDKYRHGFCLTANDFADIFDQISSLPEQGTVDDAERIEHLNIIYDEKLNKISVYQGGRWKNMLVETGLLELIECLQANYLDAYECYIIRKIVKVSEIEAATWTDRIKDYYSFLGCFEVKPFIKGRSDTEILKPSNASTNDEDTPKFTDIEAHRISDTYMALYQKTYDAITNGQRRDSKKKMLDILKRNSKHNVHELNKGIMSLLEIDDEFKQHILQRFQNFS